MIAIQPHPQPSSPIIYISCHRIQNTRNYYWPVIKVSCDILANLNLHISNSTHKLWIVSILISELYAETMHVHESQLYLSISVSNKLMPCLPSSLVSKMASHSSKNRIALLILACLKTNLKFSPAHMQPRVGKLISNIYNYG